MKWFQHAAVTIVLLEAVLAQNEALYYKNKYQVIYDTP